MVALKKRLGELETRKAELETAIGDGGSSRLVMDT
jgi:hypothetical protein